MYGRVKPKQFIFLLLAAGQGLCYLFLLSLGNLKENIVLCEAGFFTAFILYAASLALFKINQASEYPAPRASQAHLHRAPASSPAQNFYLAGILLFACCFRIILWQSPPSISDDIYRYVWKRKILAAGINPFLHAPADPQLEKYRDHEIFPNINHKDYTTIYPPVSLFIFRMCTQLSPTIKTMNMVFIIFDLLTMLVLLFTVHSLSLDFNRIVIYAWNPLVLLEFAGSGHLDSAGIFFLMLALYLFIKRQERGSIVSLALSCLSKFLPLIFLPFILIKRRFINLTIFVLIMGMCYIPFLGARDNLFQTLTTYFRKWRFNASLFDIISWIVRSEGTARIISAASVLSMLIVLVAWYRRNLQEGRTASIYQAGFILLGCIIMLTPVLHPWYLCWIIRFLVIIPNRAWILFSGTIFLAYLVLKGLVEAGSWKESMLVRVVEYVPFYGLLLFDGLRNFRQKR